MSLLRDKSDWKLKYTPDEGDLVRLFYVPALRTAVRYDRLTGYFGAGSLVLAARGVEGLVMNGGRMRLLVGLTLDEDHVQAIQRGESAREVIGRSMAVFPDVDPRSHPGAALELLAWMVARDHLEVKVALPCDEQRMPVGGTPIFHEKTGIIEDKTGDRVAFTGSINETASGWTTNWESFSLFTSWSDRERVEIEEENFARLWADRAKRAVVFDLPTAAREGLLRFLPKDDQKPRLMFETDGEGPSVEPDAPEIPIPESETPLTMDERRRDAWRQVWEAPLAPVGGDRAGEATAPVTPWPHQIRAFQRMYDHWPTRLLIADEVGLGKTIQAGLLLRQAWMAGRAKRILILAPKSVCRQWQIELREKFNLSWPIYDGQRFIWHPSPAQARLERVVSRDAWAAEPFVIMSSHLARRRERQSELITADPWDLIILDEAHHARRRGAGSAQESGPNQLLRLMRALKDRTPSLVLLTATPMQVHPVELWDLLDLLGLPPEWTQAAFLRFTADVATTAPNSDAFERLAALFRATDKAYGALSQDVVERRSGLSRLPARRVAEALRNSASIPRRQLSADQRRGALRLIRKTTPVAALMSRHTRELLRRYHAAGLLDTRIATRQVEDRFIELSPEERDLYGRVERFITDTYDKAEGAERSAVGFVMTIYRRRLASSFYALRRTLENRRAGVIDDQQREEDFADLEEAGDEAADDAEANERLAAQFEERATIETIIGRIDRLPVADTKAGELIRLLDELEATGFEQAMVFTQFTDTLDYLREQLVSKTARSVMCFTGRGGEVRDGDGWKKISRDEVKRRFREGRAEILLCTDAAAEGLNFQFCGALVNYDMPWNPMRVEQRIGRIDRLGQRFAEIRIINLHYANTVEADVYMALRTRIGLFENVVGHLQPILTQLPRLIENAVLNAAGHGADGIDAARDVDAALAAEADAIDLDEFTDDELAMPPRPEPALTLRHLEALLRAPDLLPPPVEAAPLSAFDFNYVDPDLPGKVRVTLDRDFFEQHSESVEFWTPGSPAFPERVGG